jgi:hypothetical protein
MSATGAKPGQHDHARAAARTTVERQKERRGPGWQPSRESTVSHVKG